MGSDLFGCYAESSCAALFVASISSFGISHDYTAMSYPLIISSVGIVVCLITTLFAIDIVEIKNVTEIESSFKRQLIVSNVLMTAGIAAASFFALPSEFTLFHFGTEKLMKNWDLFFCVAIGLWAGLVIGYTTEYYTSNAFRPVQDVADSCRTGAATNVIFGLALGYKSVIIPIFGIATTIYVSFSLASVYGVTVAALGMLSTIATALAIDAYGLIIDNASGIAEMAGMSHKIRERTDALVSAGNATAAIGKLAISASNTGGAWANAKKYIEAGACKHARSLGPKGSDCHKAAIVRDKIGDPLKDTSGPSLIILIKLMAVESLVFAPFFATHGGCCSNWCELKLAWLLRG